MEQKHSVETLLKHSIEPGEMTTVFVVDDDRAIREVMRDMFQRKTGSKSVPALAHTALAAG
jgi:hypothetical protein